MADSADAKAPPPDPKAENKRQALQFKAQHALMVGLFTLIAYVILEHQLLSMELTSEPVSSTRLVSTSSAPASSCPASSSSTAPNAPSLLSNSRMALRPAMSRTAVGTRRALTRLWLL